MRWPDNRLGTGVRPQFMNVRGINLRPITWLMAIHNKQTPTVRWNQAALDMPDPGNRAGWAGGEGNRQHVGHASA